MKVSDKRFAGSSLYARISLERYRLSYARLFLVNPNSCRYMFMEFSFHLLHRYLRVMEEMARYAQSNALTEDAFISHFKILNYCYWPFTVQQNKGIHLAAEYNIIYGYNAISQ